jgi:gluconokinase
MVQTSDGTAIGAGHGETRALPKRLVTMGVCGSGKSEIASRLASRLGITWVEGDDYHTAASIAKMTAGTPLDDADRREWLLGLQSRIKAAKDGGERLVVSCSALKRCYRDLLRASDPDLVFIHLAGDIELLASRMRARPGHYMPLSLLDSQLRDLEPLTGDENGIRLDIQMAPEKIVDQVLQYVTHFKSIVPNDSP